MMLNRFLPKAALAAALILAAGVGLTHSSSFIQADHPQLQLAAYDYVWQGKPATAVVYSFYLNHYPKEFFVLWQGKKIGMEYIWYDNGKLMAERSYSDGLPHGFWKLWYEDGSVKSLKKYLHGEIDGEVWNWHPNGRVADFNLYEKGRELTHKSWVSDGTPYYNYVYQDGHKVGMKGGEFCKRLEIIKK